MPRILTLLRSKDGGGTEAYAEAQGETALSAIGTDGQAYRFIYKLK